jgi:hypothetical protein
MPSLSPKENYLRTLRHEKNEYVPYGGGVDSARCGNNLSVERGNASSNFVDGFGVHWVASDSAVNALIPEPGVFLLKDITQWKKTITFPNLENIDWQRLADEEDALFKIDRDKFAVGYSCSNGPWERLAALMGFEEAMIALMEEPEACYELMDAITDYKIKLAEKIKKYYRADAFTNYDDIATERNLFMAPDTYRKLIKPLHKKLNDAIRNIGMIPIQHTCGYAELCIEDYIETGAAGWSAVQPTNNIAGILDKYGSKFCIEGGFNSNGKPGRLDVTIDELVAEVERCFREYGSKQGCLYFGSPLASVKATDAAEKNKVILDTVNRLRFAGK